MLPSIGRQAGRDWDHQDHQGVIQEISVASQAHIGDILGNAKKYFRLSRCLRWFTDGHRPVVNLLRQ